MKFNWGVCRAFFPNLLSVEGSFYKVRRHTAGLTDYIRLPMNSNLFFSLLLGIFIDLYDGCPVLMTVILYYILYITIYGSIYYIYLRILLNFAD